MPIHSGCHRGHRADAAGAAQELRGIGLGGYEVPEWKTKALGKAPTFGMRDARPIKEQRESLPIFKLRDQLVQAVAENQARCYTTPPLRGFHKHVVKEESCRQEDQVWYPKPAFDAGAGGDWRDWERQDDADDAVPGGGWLHIARAHWLHAAASRGCHEHRQARVRGGRLPAGRGGLILRG